MKNLLLIVGSVLLCSCASVSDKLSFEDLLSLYESKNFTTINNSLTAKGFLFRESNEGTSVWTKNVDYDFKEHNIIHPNCQSEETAQNIDTKNCLKVVYDGHELSLTCCDPEGLDSLVMAIEQLGYKGEETEESKKHNEDGGSAWYAKDLQKEGKPTIHFVASYPTYESSITIIEDSGEKNFSNNEETIDEGERWDFKANDTGYNPDLEVYLNGTPLKYDDEDSYYYLQNAPLFWMACKIYHELYNYSLHGEYVDRDSKEAYDAVDFANNHMFMVNQLPLSKVSSEIEEEIQKVYYDNVVNYNHGAIEWYRSYGRASYIIGKNPNILGDYELLEIYRNKEDILTCKSSTLSKEAYQKGWKF